MQSNHPFCTMSTPTVHFEAASTFDENLYTNSQTILITNHASIASTPSLDDTLKASEIVRPKIDLKMSANVIKLTKVPIVEPKGSLNLFTNFADKLTPEATAALRLKPTGSNAWPQLSPNSKLTTWSASRPYELVLGPRSRSSNTASTPMRRETQWSVLKALKRIEVAFPISLSSSMDSPCKPVTSNISTKATSWYSKRPQRHHFHPRPLCHLTHRCRPCSWPPSCLVPHSHSRMLRHLPPHNQRGPRC